ncbi:TraB/GumN family protein [Roseivivax isoporae]|uniref:GumN family protein n=1 Tax=Roseivivax isoporae LMG 25204 TaxID=1449351 RepID=X7FB42_9RHOB|nr:TraB/GumN family protein [Roseivivax isoporae]ETX30107.1 GumN family protein [Roseivivax isoporae LMG 25204]
MRLIASLVVLALSAVPALSECAGRDLRATMNAAERAELDEVLADTPYAEGNHWIARRDDTVIHLVGTVHLPDPRLESVAETLRPIVERAGKLLLEMTPRDRAELEARIGDDPDLLVLEDTSLPELMDEDSWQTLAAAAEARGIPAIVAAKMKPWYLSTILALPPCAVAGLRDGNGLDAQLQAAAEEAGVPMAPLEDFDTIFRLFGSASLATQVRMLESSLIDPEDSEDMFATLLAAYFDEKPAESWEATRILSRRMSPLPPSIADTAFDQMEATLLVRRNRDWLPVILAAAGSDPIVVAAGAAHLQGADGLARMLADEGFTLERAPF